MHGHPGSNLKIQKGSYVTFDGKHAVVAQLKPLQGEQWITRGAIEHEGVLWLHVWDQYGMPLSLFPGNNLLDREFPSKEVA